MFKYGYSDFGINSEANTIIFNRHHLEEYDTIEINIDDLYDSKNEYDNEVTTISLTRKRYASQSITAPMDVYNEFVTDLEKYNITVIGAQLCKCISDSNPIIDYSSPNMYNGINYFLFDHRLDFPFVLTFSEEYDSIHWESPIICEDNLCYPNLIVPPNKLSRILPSVIAAIVTVSVDDKHYNSYLYRCKLDMIF